MAAAAPTINDGDVKQQIKFEITAYRNGVFGNDLTFELDPLCDSQVGRLSKSTSTVWNMLLVEVSINMLNNGVPAPRVAFLQGLQTRDLALATATDMVHWCNGGQWENPGSPVVAALALPARLAKKVVQTTCQMHAGVVASSIDDRVAGVVRRSGAYSRALGAQALEDIRRRIVVRIQHQGTADDAAFNAAKDGESAIRALTGAAAAERRRILANGGSGPAVAVAFAASLGKQ